MAPGKTAEIKEIYVSPLVEGYRLEARKSTNPGRPGMLGERTLSLPSPYVKVASDPGFDSAEEQSATGAVRAFRFRALVVLSASTDAKSERNVT
jgi:hypothetical protein